MSTFDEGFVVTDVGLAIQSKQLANGEALKFSRAAYGAGMQPDGTDLRTVTAMVDEKLELEIVKSSVVGNGTVDITVMVDNTNVEAPGFPLTEVGMYAMDGDTEILYAYAYFGDRHGWVPSATDARKIRNTMHFDIVIGRTTQVEVKLSSDWSAFATTEDFEAHKDSENPHPNMAKVGDEVETVDWFNCGLTEPGGKINRISIDNARKTILGDMSTIPVLQSRVRQLERENANLALRLEAEGMMPDCNMLLAENFENLDSVDNFVVDVTSCAAGDDSIDVVSNYGFIVGSWYWITDGVHAEYVQVKSVIKNGSIFRVILTKPLVETYQIEQTKIYRTTAWISEQGVVYGSGDVLGVTYTPKVTWRGTSEGGVADSNEQLLTSQDNTDNFDVDGVVFTDSDLISLA